MHLTVQLNLFYLLYIQGMDKIMEKVVHSHFSINMELGPHLLVKQLVSYLKLTYISSEQSPVEYCTTLHEEHLLVP